MITLKISMMSASVNIDSILVVIAVNSLRMFNILQAVQRHQHFGAGAGSSA